MPIESTALLAGIPELMVLRLLQIREMYGYEIVQAISVKTSGVVSPGEGLVYPLLHSLEKDGALKSRRKAVNGRTRTYYVLTPRGVKKLETLSGDWTALSAAVQKVMHAV
jgi:PadR family transcriptional regulator PadR